MTVEEIPAAGPDDSGPVDLSVERAKKYIGQYRDAMRDAVAAIEAIPDRVEAWRVAGGLGEVVAAHRTGTGQLRAQQAARLRADEGLSLAELATRLGISRGRAQDFVEAAHAKPKSPPVQPDTVDGPALFPPPGMTTALYRRFDADGRLLYLGVTDSLPTRNSAHRQRSSWTEFTEREEVEWFASRAEAEAAEAASVRVERPLFNDRGQSNQIEARARLVAYLVEKGRLDLLAPAVSRG